MRLTAELPFPEWLAVALGYQSRITGAVKARIKNAPAQSKAALDTAVADDPRNAYAVSALGGWHIEVVRGGGATLARMFYGARETTALSLFDRSASLAPADFNASCCSTVSRWSIMRPPVIRGER